MADGTMTRLATQQEPVWGKNEVYSRMWNIATLRVGRAWQLVATVTWQRLIDRMQQVKI